MLGLGAVSSAAQADALGQLRRSVFKIHLISEDPDFQNPWNMQPTASSTGTGFYIGKHRILTNAHVCSNARYITLQRDGDAKAVPARVEFIAHDADLAILTVEDKTYFQDVRALEFGGLPKLRSPVSAIGYPLGGEQLSVTEGIVSRLGYRTYVHSGVKNHLLIQVDSAINPGNSGGPVVQRGQVIGVAFQSFVNAEATGYVIPVVVVKRFLKDIEDGRYDGHPDEGLTVQDGALSNPQTAEWHGIKPSEGGVKVATVQRTAPTFGKILPGDVILAVDKRPVGVDGRIDFQGERVEFSVLFDLRQMGETVTYSIVRDRERLRVPVVVAPSTPGYRQSNVYGRHPRFFVWGGLVFEALSRDLLTSFGRNWFRTAPATLRYAHQFGAVDEDWSGLEDIVVLIGVLPHPVNTWISNQVNGVLTTIDGEKVTSLAQAKRLLESARGEYQLLEFAGGLNPLALNRDQVVKSQAGIIKKYGIDPPEWFLTEAMEQNAPAEGKQ
jgi:S1-C subfamily serine protease